MTPATAATTSFTYSTLMKRTLDICGAGLALTLLVPILAVSAMAIWLRMGYPVLFTQLRPGLHGKLFRMYKFRTMRNDRDHKGHLLPDSERVTRIGQILRKASIDELPELWNVLRGDMSLVGPRPLLPEYLPYYTEREQLRHSVRPGLTGLAQIRGRNHLGWNERLELDAQYAESHTLWLDLKIILITVYKVLLAKDVALDPMPPFNVHRELANHCESQATISPRIMQRPY